MERTRTLIVGGGPAGAAAAIQLGRAGHAPLLIEREPGPRDVVCGGFLGWDALSALQRLGVDAFALGAQPIRTLRLVSPRRAVEARLPHRAAGLSRRTLDEALLARAAGEGAEVRRGVRARSADAAARAVWLPDGDTIAADALILATGKHDLRGVRREGAREASRTAVGLRTALPATPDRRTALDGVIELHVFDDGYAGLLLQEDGAANFCLSVSERRFMAARGAIRPLLHDLQRENPLLAERLRGGPPGEWRSIAQVPYGWRARTSDAGLFRAGDQAAVIASLAGDGIAIALSSGIQAAAALLAEGPDAAPRFQRRLARRAARPLFVAGRLRAMAESPGWREKMLRAAGAFPAAVSAAARLTRIG